MNWLIAYLVSIIVAPTIFGIIVLSNTNKKLELCTGEDAFVAFILAIFWPISMTIRTYMWISVDRKHKAIKKANELLRWKISTDQMGDRSSIIDVPEGDLKAILRAYRKKHIEMTPQQVAIVRDELMHRNAERDLLK